MSKPSTEVKSRWNAKAYDVISVRIPKELSVKFREAAAADGVSQAGIIKNAIEEYIAKRSIIL